MNGKHCRLYDEQLVKNIMITTGLAALDFLKDKKFVDEEDLCEYIAMNAESIIEDTLEEMNDVAPLGESEQGKVPGEPWGSD